MQGNDRLKGSRSRMILMARAEKVYKCHFEQSESKENIQGIPESTSALLKRTKICLVSPTTFKCSKKAYRVGFSHSFVSFFVCFLVWSTEYKERSEEAKDINS